MKKPTKKRGQPLNVPQGEAPPQLIEWNDADVAALAAFLRSSTGQKLRAYQLSGISGYNEWATNQTEVSSDRGNGQAQGFKKHFDFILSLAAAQSGNTEPPADTNGTAGTFAHLRP